MNEEQINQLTIDTVNRQNSSNQFTVAPTSFHTHNGTDSRRVSYSNLSDRTLVIPYTLFGTQSATAGNYGIFFIAPYAMTISTITEVHQVLGTGGACTVQIEKLTGTTAPGSGSAILTTGFNLVGTINTVQTGTLSNAIGVVQLAQGDRLALLLSGTPTSVSNVTITITAKLI